MLLNDERELWFSELEDLSVMLENKTRDEILEILDANGVISIRQGEVKSTFVQRLVCGVSFIPLLLLLYTLSGIKKLITGDGHLNSWVKRAGLENWMKKYTVWF